MWVFKKYFCEDSGSSGGGEVIGKRTVAEKRVLGGWEGGSGKLAMLPTVMVILRSAL